MVTAGFGFGTAAERGQALTLEALLAATLLVGSLLFALQVTAVTPMSTSTSNEQIESQQARHAAGVLDSAIENESVRPTLLYWNNASASFHGAGEKGFYRNGPPATAFGRLLERTLGDRAIAYNVDLRYLNEQGSIRRQELVGVGTPSDNVATATRTVTLYDDDVLYDESGSPTNTTVSNATNVYAPDAAPNSSIYNVIRVEVMVWRR